MLIRNWRHVYTSCRDVSIDECLVHFKGRSKHLQYIPSKPHKWGIKVWCLSENCTGYVTNWSMYTGKLKPDGSQRTATHRIVMDICDPILIQEDRCTWIILFTSPALYTELPEHQTGACGTLRTNRTGVPQAVKTADPPLGEVMSQKEGKLLYIIWKDKRRMNILSTIHNSSTYTKKLRSRFSENITEMLTGQRLLVYIQNICQVLLTLLTSKWHTIPCSIACWSGGRKSFCVTFYDRTGVPQAVKTADPPLGEVMSQKEGKLLYIIWKDKRRMNILSTIHNSSTYTKKLRSRFSENITEMLTGQRLLVYIQNICQVLLTLLTSKWHTIPCSIACWSGGRKSFCVTF